MVVKGFLVSSSHVVMGVIRKCATGLDASVSVFFLHTTRRCL